MFTGERVRVSPLYTSRLRWSEVYRGETVDRKEWGCQAGGLEEAKRMIYGFKERGRENSWCERRG